MRTSLWLREVCRLNLVLLDLEANTTASHSNFSFLPCVGLFLSSLCRAVIQLLAWTELFGHLCVSENDSSRGHCQPPAPHSRALHCCSVAVHHFVSAAHWDHTTQKNGIFVGNYYFHSQKKTLLITSDMSVTLTRISSTYGGKVSQTGKMHRQPPAI